MYKVMGEIADEYEVVAYISKVFDAQNNKDASEKAKELLNSKTKNHENRNRFKTAWYKLLKSEKPFSVQEIERASFIYENDEFVKNRSE